MSNGFQNYEQAIGKAHTDQLKQEAALKAKRQQQGLSQQALADAIGLKPASFSLKCPRY